MVRKRDGVIWLAASDVPVTGEELASVWWQGRKWAVTEYGIECPDGSYAIEAARVTEGLDGGDATGLQHLAEKPWVDLDDFATAWMLAVVMHGKAAGAKLEDVRKAIRGLPEWAGLR